MSRLGGTIFDIQPGSNGFFTRYATDPAAELLRTQHESIRTIRERPEALEWTD
jgi:hypothetical protein